MNPFAFVLCLKPKKELQRLQHAVEEFLTDTFKEKTREIALSTLCTRECLAVANAINRRICDTPWLCLETDEHDLAYAQVSLEFPHLATQQSSFLECRLELWSKYLQQCTVLLVSETFTPFLQSERIKETDELQVFESRFDLETMKNLLEATGYLKDLASSHARTVVDQAHENHSPASIERINTYSINIQQGLEDELRRLGQCRELPEENLLELPEVHPHAGKWQLTVKNHTPQKFERVHVLNIDREEHVRIVSTLEAVQPQQTTIMELKLPTNAYFSELALYWRDRVVSNYIEVTPSRITGIECIGHNFLRVSVVSDINIDQLVKLVCCDLIFEEHFEFRDNSQLDLSVRFDLSQCQGQTIDFCILTVSNEIFSNTYSWEVPPADPSIQSEF